MELGARLKEIRRGKGITLQEVARETGLSKSFVSQVEAGDANPSIASLKKIADALTIPLAALFEVQSNGVDGGAQDRSEAGNQAVNDVRVVKKHQRKMLVWPGQDGSKTYLLTPDLQRKLEVTFAELNPGHDSGLDTYSHKGEECGFVLEGALEVTVLDQVYRLEAGDSISFPSHLPHRIRVFGDTLTKTVWVITPPSY